MYIYKRKYYTILQRVESRSRETINIRVVGTEEGKGKW